MKPKVSDTKPQNRGNEPDESYAEQQERISEEGRSPVSPEEREEEQKEKEGDE